MSGVLCGQEPLLHGCLDALCLKGKMYPSTYSEIFFMSALTCAQRRELNTNERIKPTVEFQHI